MDIKDTLKAIKMNESAISIVLGAVIVLIVGILVYNYFSTPNQGETIPAAETERLSAEMNNVPEVGGVYVVREGEIGFDAEDSLVESDEEAKRERRHYH